MKRDITVTITFLSLAAMFGYVFYTGKNIEYDENDGVLGIVLVATILMLSLRVMILWLQTLIHAVRKKGEESRVGWLVAHVILGPFASFAYYYSNDPSIEKELKEKKKPWEV
ncbi:hypothetical protein MLD52_20320 [Puniceicoccaceae bacterium K14]|nr:hypothetical protein [Puniceicoccaceae bacterium K14]